MEFSVSFNRAAQNLSNDTKLHMVIFKPRKVIVKKVRKIPKIQRESSYLLLSNSRCFHWRGHSSPGVHLGSGYHPQRWPWWQQQRRKWANCWRHSVGIFLPIFTGPTAKFAGASTPKWTAEFASQHWRHWDRECGHWPWLHRPSSRWHWKGQQGVYGNLSGKYEIVSPFWLQILSL